MKDKLNDFLYKYILPYGGLVLVRLMSATYRVRYLDIKHETDVLKQKKSILYASWHQRFFAGMTCFSKRKPLSIMVSQSRDGEMISRLGNALGVDTVRGSSSRGGRKALQKLRKLAKKGYRIAHITDGPRGPFGGVKAGLIKIAQFAKTPVMPVIVSPERKWVFHKSWDKFMVPKPFSRVIIRFGAPIPVDRKLDETEFEHIRQEVENKMKSLYASTDRKKKKKNQVDRIFGKG